MGFISDFKDERRRKRLIQEAHELTVYAYSLVQQINDNRVRYTSLINQLTSNDERFNIDFGDFFEDEKKLKNPFYAALFHGDAEALDEKLQWYREIPSTIMMHGEFLFDEDGTKYATVKIVEYAKLKEAQEPEQYSNTTSPKNWVSLERHPTIVANHCHFFRQIIADRASLTEGLPLYRELINDEQNVVDAISSLNDMVARLKSVSVEIEDTIVRLTTVDDEERSIENVDEDVAAYLKWKQHI